jgi:hypothetical protein
MGGIQGTSSTDSEGDFSWEAVFRRGSTKELAARTPDDSSTGVLTLPNDAAWTHRGSAL